MNSTKRTVEPRINQYRDRGDCLPVNPVLSRDLYGIRLINKDLVLYRKLPRFKCTQASGAASPEEISPWNFCCTMIVSLLACTSYPAASLPMCNTD